MTKRDYKTGGTQASITPHASPSWRQVNNNVTARKYNVLFHINVAKRNVGERDASLSWTLRIDWIGESAFFSQLLVRFMLLLRPNPNWPPRGTQDLDVLIRDVCDDALQTTQLINDDDVDVHHKLSTMWGYRHAWIVATGIGLYVHSFPRFRHHDSSKSNIVDAINVDVWRHGANACPETCTIKHKNILI